MKKRCWKGYAPVKGKKPYSKGSCRKVRGNPTGIPPRLQETFEEYGVTNPKTQKQMMSVILRSLPAGKRTLDGMESAIEKYFKKMGQKAYDETMKSMGYVRSNPAPYPDLAMANELYLYFQNDENLINRRYPEFVKNLERKVKRGIYDREKAVKLFMYLADEVSKKYSKDFGDGKTHWASVPTRMELAKMLLRYYEISRDPSHRVVMNPSHSPAGYHYMPDGRLMADSEHSVSTNPRGIDPNLAYKKEYGWTFVEFLKKRLIPDLRESGMYATIADYQRGISLYNDKKGVLPSTQYLNYLKYLRETLIPDLKESGSESTAADFERMYKMVLYTWNNQPKIRKTKYRRDLDDR